MTLADLPQFRIDSRERLPGGWLLRGTFNHLKTVHEGRSWLYAPQTALIGDLEGLDPITRRASFVTPDDVPEDARALAWFDAWWQARQIAIILDSRHAWRPVVFEAADALVSRLPGWAKLRPATEATPDEGEVLAPNAWDHEHCMICNAHIDPGGAGYLDDERNWLCPLCYARYAARQDLSFLRG